MMRVEEYKHPLEVAVHALKRHEQAAHERLLELFRQNYETNSPEVLFAAEEVALYDRAQIVLKAQIQSEITNLGDKVLPGWVKRNRDRTLL